MADSYLQFSAVLTDLSPQETSWLKSQLEIVYVLDGKEGADPADATWIGCRAYRDMGDYDPDFGEDGGFAYSFSEDVDDTVDVDWGPYLRMYSEEHACVDRVAHLARKFLREFRPDRCWSLTYAITCSKPRVGEFGGGAVFVTATDVKHFNAWESVEKQEKQHELQKDIARLVRKAEDLGVQSEDLDDVVHDTADSLAASIDNSGLDDQIAWLVDQLGIGDVETYITNIAAADIAVIVWSGIAQVAPVWPCNEPFCHSSSKVQETTEAD
jgi:hypothetical protein